MGLYDNASQYEMGSWIIEPDDGDMMGSGDEDMVGNAIMTAPPPAGMQYTYAPQAGLPAGQAPILMLHRPGMAPQNVTGQMMQARTTPTEDYDVVLPMSSLTTIAAAAPGTASNTCQKRFQPKRLVVDPTAAALFTIQSVSVGVLPQLAATGSVPATMFMSTAVGVNLRGDIADVGQTISVAVTNTSGGAASFLSGIIGPDLTRRMRGH